MKQKKRMTRPVKLALIAAAVVVLLTGTVLAIHYTRITEFMEQHWNETGSTEMTAEQKDFVESRSAAIGESITDGGITVTVDSVTCTSNTVYYLYTVEVGGAYALENLSNVNLDETVCVVSEEYGKIRFTSGGGSTLEQSGNLFTCEAMYHFEEVPEGTSLADGTFTMQLRFDSGELYYTGDLEHPVSFDGTWDFEIPLPESGTVAAITASDTVLDFGSGVTLSLSNIIVTDSGCTFTAAANQTRYLITAYQDEEALTFMREREPDKVFISFRALFADGTEILNDSSGASLDEATGQYHHHIDWSVPVDPTQLTALRFSDGTTEIEIPLQ